MGNVNTLINVKLEELNDIVEQTYYLEQKAFELKNKIEKNKDIISRSMGKSKTLNVKVDDSLSFSAVKRVKPIIEFSKVELAKKFERKIYNQMVDKKVVVDNLDGLIKMLKDHGVSAREFKQYITVEEEVNRDSIDGLIRSEEIDIKSLEGCYSASYDESISVRRHLNKSKRKRS